MREIKNNVEIGKVQKAGLKKEKAERAETSFCGEVEGTPVKDFSNPSAEVLGRSQVSKTDNLKEDVSFGMAHPEVISNSDKLFDIAFRGLQAAGDPEAYEKACSIVTSSEARELLSK